MPVFVWLIFTVFIVFIAAIVVRKLWLESYVKNLPKIPFKLLAPFCELRSHKSPVEIYQYAERVLNYRNGLTSLWIGLKLTVICDDPINMKTILLSKQCLNKPYFYRMLAEAGNGLFTATSHDWYSDRKGLNTVFSLSNLKTFHPIFNRYSSDFAKSLEKYVDQSPSDLTKPVFESSLKSICYTNFHFDIESRKDLGTIIDYIERLWTIYEERGTSILYQSSFVYQFSNLYAEHKKIHDYLFQVISQIIEKNDQGNQSTGMSNEPTAECKETKNIILIDKLIEMERRGLMDHQRVRDQINTFIAAGIDTSSVTLLNTLLLLAIHQDVQDRLFDEIRSTGTNADYIDYNALMSMEYLDRVMKESMRLLPVSQFWMRETEGEVQLTNCSVPKGTILILSIFKMHRNVDIWGPTANEFDPDHFLPEAVAKRHPFSFLPFSTGPRNCIGYKYAMISLKVQLCHLLLRYKFTTSLQMSDITFRHEFMLKLENKYMLKLEKRCTN